MVAMHPTSVKDVVVLSPEKRDRFGVKACCGFPEGLYRDNLKGFLSLILPFGSKLNS